MTTTYGEHPQVLIDPRDGHLITDGTWKYKIPAVSCVPETLNVYFLEVGVLGRSSKNKIS